MKVAVIGAAALGLAVENDTDSASVLVTVKLLVAVAVTTEGVSFSVLESAESVSSHPQTV